MPTIIKEGKTGLHPRRMTCPDCGTIFEAWYREFTYHYRDGGGGKYTIDCPLMSCNNQMEFNSDEMTSLHALANP